MSLEQVRKWHRAVIPTIGIFESSFLLRVVVLEQLTDSKNPISLLFSLDPTHWLWSCPSRPESKIFDQLSAQRSGLSGTTLTGPAPLPRSTSVRLRTNVVILVLFMHCMTHLSVRVPCNGMHDVVIFTYSYLVASITLPPISRSGWFSVWNGATDPHRNEYSIPLGRDYAFQFQLMYRQHTLLTDNIKMWLVTWS